MPLNVGSSPPSESSRLVAPGRSSEPVVVISVASVSVVDCSIVEGEGAAVLVGGSVGFSCVVVPARASKN
jgi:hypothetical protein